MAIYEERRRLDVDKSVVTVSLVEPIYLRRGETNATKLVAELYDGNRPIDLTGFTELTFRAMNAEGHTVVKELTLVQSADHNVVEYEVTSDLTAAAGKVALAYLQVEKGKIILCTQAIPIIVLQDVCMGAEEAHEYKNLIDELMDKVKEALEKLVYVVSSKVDYASSNDGINPPQEGWSSAIPAGGDYIWSRTTYKFNKGPDLVVYSVARQGKDGINIGNITVTVDKPDEPPSCDVSSSLSGNTRNFTFNFHGLGGGSFIDPTAFKWETLPGTLTLDSRLAANNPRVQVSGNKLLNILKIGITVQPVSDVTDLPVGVYKVYTLPVGWRPKTQITLNDYCRIRGIFNNGVSSTDYTSYHKAIIKTDGTVNANIEQERTGVIDVCIAPFPIDTTGWQLTIDELGELEAVKDWVKEQITQFTMHPPTLQIGTVTKLSPEETPTVTNVGDEQHAILDFGLPQGEPGEVDGNVYKFIGDSTFASLPEPSAETEGNVYNITDEFVTDDRFVIPSKTHPAGTNAVVVSTGDAYKYDAFAGGLDDYIKSAELVKITDAEIEKMYDGEA